MKKYIYIFGILLSLGILQFSSNPEDTDLKFVVVPPDFVYDGCSHFPDWNYFECCLEHDKKYFFGGNWRERYTADVELMQCVQSKGGKAHKVLGPAMFFGVRIGGAPIFPTSFRWGFGRDIY